VVLAHSYYLFEYNANGVLNPHREWAGVKITHKKKRRKTPAYRRLLAIPHCLRLATIVQKHRQIFQTRIEHRTTKVSHSKRGGEAAALYAVAPNPQLVPLPYGIRERDSPVHMGYGEWDAESG